MGLLRLLLLLLLVLAGLFVRAGLLVRARLLVLALLALGSGLAVLALLFRRFLAEAAQVVVIFLVVITKDDIIILGGLAKLILQLVREHTIKANSDRLLQSAPH